MKAYTIEEMMTKLMKNGGFGEVIFPVEPVSGGFMHRMYKVRTETGIYAVKHLNPEIMARDGVLDNYARAEKLERLLEEAEIPIVPAVTVHGKKMQTTEGNYFYIFHWQEGHITDWDTISTEECRMAGTILGKIHAINPQNVAHKEPEQSNINWYGYLQKAETEKKRNSFGFG